MADIDDDWGDDFFAGTFNISPSSPEGEQDEDGDAHDRITAVPDFPAEQYVARAMGGAPASPLERTGAEPEQEPPTRAGGDRFADPAPPLEKQGPLRYSESIDPPIPETLPPTQEPEPSAADTHRARDDSFAILDDLDLNLEDDLDSSSPAHAPPLMGDNFDGSERHFDLRRSEPPAPKREEPLRASLKDRYALGDFSGALEVAEEVLDSDPEDLEAARYAQSCRDVLGEMYRARLGALDSVVKVVIAEDRIRWLTLDHRAGFMLSLIDGASTTEELLDICGMPRLDALRILTELLEQRIIALGHP